MSDQQATAFKPKKSVALSGVTAGNTALCTVGKTGNDLHYRGYDILDVANTSEFEEIAYLLVHGKLPTTGDLKGYKATGQLTLSGPRALEKAQLRTAALGDRQAGPSAEGRRHVWVPGGAVVVVLEPSREQPEGRAVATGEALGEMEVKGKGTISIFGIRPS